MSNSTPKQRFIDALELRQPDQVPTFELEFQLTKELLGKEYPYESSWEGMEIWKKLARPERDSLIDRIADLYIEVAERLEYSAIMVCHPPRWIDDQFVVVRRIKEKVGDKYMLIVHGDVTYAIPDGEKILEIGNNFICLKKM